MPKTVVLLATLETKEEEAAFMREALITLGLSVQVVDISLRAGGTVLAGAEKMRAINATGTRVRSVMSGKSSDGLDVVVGIGGGIGGEIVLQILGGLSATFPKVLITPLPFDPRPALADNSIILVPTLVDIAGLNDTLRHIFTSAAAMVAGLCQAPSEPARNTPSVGLTALGTTGGAAEAVISGLRDLGQECFVFHANGYGGAGFVRFAQNGAFKAVIDMTSHELNRLIFGGDHIPMSHRFTAAADLPQIVLPGGLNFLGLGTLATLTNDHRMRAHYAHSSFFTHVKVSVDEMTESCETLSRYLNAARAPVMVIVPMGGFSHQDQLGGEIEDLELRHVCLDVLRANADHYTIESIPYHINAPETAAHILRSIKPFI